MVPRRIAELLRPRPLPPATQPAEVPPPPLVVLILKRAGTTLAAESRASNVITQAATTMNPREWKWVGFSSVCAGWV